MGAACAAEASAAPGCSADPTTSSSSCSDKSVEPETLRARAPSLADSLDLCSGAHLVCHRAGLLKDVYLTEDALLGEGSFGRVRRGTHRATGAARAIKSVPKRAVESDRKAKLLQREIAIMEMVDHPSIVKLYETFQDGDHVHLVTELCLGGDLAHYLGAVGQLVELEAAMAMQQILGAVLYLHEHSICHRDLKLQNVLMLTQGSVSDPLQRLKVIDFGLSCVCLEGRHLTARAGSLRYMAPEVLTGSYGKECDLWSAGVIMYTLLSGRSPFYGKTPPELIRKLQSSKCSVHIDHRQDISDDAKAIVKGLLQHSPSKRLCAFRALSCAWLWLEAVAATHGDNCVVPRAPLPKKDLVRQLESFRAQGRITKLALQAISRELDDAQVCGARDLFLALDGDGDGRLSPAELSSGLRDVGLQVPGLEEIMCGATTDGSGRISYTEFLAASLQRHTYLQRDVSWAAFCAFDLDGDGCISRDELEQVCAEAATPRSFQEADTNNDGRLDFGEFYTLLSSAGAKQVQETLTPSVGPTAIVIEA